jgi:UV DNA damage endonuclease
MKIRLGYVATALRLENCSPARTITLYNINKIESYEDQVHRLTRIASENLANTLRILKANHDDGIKVYRFTSNLVPLCTHPQFRNWDYRTTLEDSFREIGAFVKSHGMRVSLHPDHFTLLNSPKPEIYEASCRDLAYHATVLEAMGLSKDVKMVIHVGGKYDDKFRAIDRFKGQFGGLPANIKDRLVLENDDRCFTAREVLTLSQEIEVPMVLDLHHHQILNDGEDLASLLPQILATWGDELPKIHISSPRNSQTPRYHADYIDADTTAVFLNSAKTLNRDFDLMIEAKQKDLALLKLARELSEKGFRMPDQGTIYI